MSFWLAALLETLVYDHVHVVCHGAEVMVIYMVCVQTCSVGASGTVSGVDVEMVTYDVVETGSYVAALTHDVAEMWTYHDHHASLLTNREHAREILTLTCPDVVVTSDFYLENLILQCELCVIQIFLDVLAISISTCLSCEVTVMLTL